MFRRLEHFLLAIGRSILGGRVRLGWGACVLGAGLLAVLPAPGRADTVDRYPVIDLHVDLPYQVGYKGRALDRGRGRYVGEWVEAAGIEAAAFPLFVPNDVSPDGPRGQDLDDSYRRIVSLLPSAPAYHLQPCTGRRGVGVFWALEGAAPLGQDLESVWEWGRRGLSLVGLVHAHDNPLATSAGYGFRPRRVRRGVSPLGAEVVRRVYAIGGLTDVSHASDAAFDDLVDLALAEGVPAVATHSNARALAPHTRNLSDSQLRAIAATGGIVGVNFHSPFLLGGPGTATMQDVVRHVRHIARVAGIDHVAIGSDFEGGIRPPLVLSDVRGFPKLALALLEGGFAPAEVRKVLAGNARRLLCSRRNPPREP